MESTQITIGGLDYIGSSDWLTAELYEDGVELRIFGVNSNLEEPLRAGFVTVGPRGGVRGAGNETTLEGVDEWVGRYLDARTHLRNIGIWRTAYFTTLQEDDS